MTLPQGWAETTLGDCQAKTSSISPRREPGTEFDLFSVPAHASYKPDCARGSEIGSSKQQVQANDVLLCKIVPHIRRGWVVPAPQQRPQIASGEWIVFRDHALEPEFLRRFVVSDDFHHKFMLTVSGVGGSLMRARPADAARIAVPVPPAAEQRRIVAKLDALTVRLARARAELDRLPVLAARLRKQALSSALNGAIESSLQSSWRQEDQKELQQRRRSYLQGRRGSRLRTDISDTLVPLVGSRAGWFDCQLADVISLRVGYAFKSADFSKTEGVPLLRGINVAPGYVDWSDRARLRPEATAKTMDYVLGEGDIVIAMDRPIIAAGLKIARVKKVDAGALLVQRVANPRPMKWITPEYLMLILRSDLFLGQIESHATGTDLPHISGNDILTTPCPLPPLPAQKIIAATVETAFARADRLEAEAARARALIDRLEAAILARAFRGELVPQDPDDEPASVLLDRIRAQRAAAPKPKGGRCASAAA